MCGQCDEVNRNADPKVVHLLKLTVQEMDEFQAVTTMAYLEQGGIPVPSPSEVDDDPVKGLLSLADEYPFQVTIAARDAVRDTNKFLARLTELREAGDILGVLQEPFPSRF